jgi:hypothetical protein
MSQTRAPNLSGARDSCDQLSIHQTAARSGIFTLILRCTSSDPGGKQSQPSNEQHERTDGGAGIHLWPGNSECRPAVSADDEHEPGQCERCLM